LVLVPGVFTGVFPLVLVPGVLTGVFPLVLVPSVGFPLVLVPSVGFPLASVLGVKLGVDGSEGTWLGVREESNNCLGEACSMKRFVAVPTGGQTRTVVGVAVFFAYKQTTDGRTEPEQKENPHPK
jgi:hypothetical protein